MKKAIIILAILSIITIGFGVYEGYLYFESLNKLNTAETAKDELVKNNTGCELWKNVEEVLKKTTE